MKQLKIVYEDKYLAVVDKPSGLPVIPAPGSKHDLTALLGEQLSLQGPGIKAYPCHRIDRDTSGLIIFAKDRHSQQAVTALFKKREVKKKYIAFVQGSFKRDRGTVKGFLSGAWPYRQDRRKKLAITQYKCLCRRDQFSVLELEPLTGRTNQIRIQMKELGYPLLGERRFAFGREWKIKFKRVALHAAGIGFRHPGTGKFIELRSALPEDMRGLLETHGISLKDLC